MSSRHTMKSLHSDLLFVTAIIIIIGCATHEMQMIQDLSSLSDRPYHSENIMIFISRIKRLCVYVCVCVCVCVCLCVSAGVENNFSEAETDDECCSTGSGKGTGLYTWSGKNKIIIGVPVLSSNT